MATPPPERCYLDADGVPSTGAEQVGCRVTAEAMLERLSREPSLNERVLSVAEYLEPSPGALRRGPSTLHEHHYAVVQTERWWWSLERRADGPATVVVVQRARDFNKVQGRCQGRHRVVSWLSEAFGGSRAPRCEREQQVTNGARLGAVLSALVRRGVLVRAAPGEAPPTSEGFVASVLDACAAAGDKRDSVC